MAISKYVFPALLVMAFAVPALAESPAKKPEGERTMRSHPADANKDGVLSRAEFDAHNAARFAEMDKNGDGNVTADEMKSHFDARRAEMSERMKNRPEGERRGGMPRGGRGEAAPVPEAKQ